MIKFFKKPFRWAAVYTLVLSLFTTFVLLDTFVIPKKGVQANSVKTTSSGSTAKAAFAASSANISNTSYDDGNIKINITTERKYDTSIYTADIQLSSVDYLKTAFADNTFGRNIKEKTSTIAKNSNAILAINGDYYGFRNYGYVIRNGTLYRSTSRSQNDSWGDEDLVIDSSGNFSIIKESDVTAQSLAKEKVLQVLSFGPSLINNSKLTVNESSEVSQAMASNPRTAIGQISPLHYVFVVSDGRTNESAGLSLYQLASVLKEKGCTIAYNLDGGGSSTMWFNGKVINKPTTTGNDTSERKVSDIVYIGY